MPQKDDATRLDPNTYPLKYETRVLFADLDVLRHINNISIARYFEEGRSAFLMSLFGERTFDHSPDVPRIFLANANIDYIAQGFYPGSVQVCTGANKLGRSSILVQQAAFQNGSCIALCEATLVSVMGDHPTQIPEDLKSKLDPLMRR